MRGRAQVTGVGLSGWVKDMRRVCRCQVRVLVGDRQGGVMSSGRVWGYKGLCCLTIMVRRMEQDKR